MVKDIKLMKEEYANRFFKGAGFEIMHQLPNNSVDIVLCDLLYGIAQNKWSFVVATLLLSRRTRMLNFLRRNKSVTSKS